ncbi:MAG TPA: XRE family transcriptional regulator [Flavobacteriaceae bacterium]|nr:XRE family transcriptional regulator [Flavobacteriaceae bacterium]
MINNTEFSKRLKRVLEYYQLSASQFAEKIDVQRSSISHLLSGRNKPSLDFVLKVLESFKEVELYWLLNGKGKFPKVDEKLEYPSTLFSGKEQSLENKSPLNKKEEEIIQNYNTASFNSEIEKIVVFYKNGSFKLYNEIE